MQPVSVELGEPIDPVAVGARTGLLWAGDGVALAGVGERCVIGVDRPGAVAVAQSELARLGERGGAVAGEAARRPPVAFGALAFDPEAPGELIVPRLVVGVDQDGTGWVSGWADGPDDAVEEVRALAATAPVGPHRPPAPVSVVSSVPAPVWRDDVVGEARRRIRSGELRKVVLAREVTVTAPAPIDRGAVIAGLRRRFPSTNVFAVNDFIGASPELLVGRSGDEVRAHPLAGTAARAAAAAVDAEVIATLVASTKDQWEHRITIEWFLRTLLPYCSFVDAEPEPSVVTLANVHHLGTRVRGRLSSPAASVLELVAALHPTPAVGGEPQDRALALIDELEPGDRGRYAGAVGWVDGAGNGSFAVAIRSAVLDGARARLWAGVGVVADSDPEAELAETEAKLGAMLSVLGA